MEYMAQKMDEQIEGGISENERMTLHISELEAILREALSSFKCTQRVLAYPEYHWSRRACALLNEDTDQHGYIAFTRP